jgi:hypothetical protein
MPQKSGLITYDGFPMLAKTSTTVSASVVRKTLAAA